ncbi:Integrase, catalytic core [Cucumis melo var. makuwa]|uniref:Integrase, catalytic core n=1 Tax=Cucumis melo var. makuwa TaxID=1194695 RepID=A0A5D3D6B5_CUCMM|nr:Integrase, catalytic core [Cucumis melo var. makuwa]TYK19060.1 Integrase, catalytic core [Cucumis melo var. makuwa]
MDELASLTILLYLIDGVLRLIDEATTTTGVVEKARRLEISKLRKNIRMESYSWSEDEDTLRKKCPFNKCKEASSSKYLVKTSAANIIDRCGSTEVLIVSHNDIQDAWIIDSREMGQFKCESNRSGYAYKFENGGLKVTKGSLVKLRGTLKNGLYVLEGTAVSSSATIASVKGPTMPSVGGLRYFLSIIDDFSRKV